MPIGALSRFPNQCRSSVVCIDGYENKVFAGTLHNSCLAEPLAFNSLVQLIEQIEMLLDYMAIPQSSTERRSFSAMRPAEVIEQQLRQSTGGPPLLPEGKLGTFSIRILFRQNASWQGTVRWVEENKEKQFRSVLELIFLLDSAIVSRTKRTGSLFDDKSTATG